MAPEAAYLVGTVKDGVPLMETKAADTAAPSADLVEGMPESSEAISRKSRCEGKCPNCGVAPISTRKNTCSFTTLLMV